MTGKEIAPMEAFMDRVKAKLRDDIGSMLPDDVVAAMVQKVVDDEFFKPRHIPKPGRSSYSTETIAVPSAFAAMVVEAVNPIIKARAEELLVSKAEEIDEIIKKMVADGFTAMFMRAVDGALTSALQNQQWSIQNALMNLMRQDQ